MIKKNITKSSKFLVDEAKKQISNISANDAVNLHKDKNYLFIDLRDIRELKNTGKIKDAMHVPRGMLEFWIDPDSPYHKDFFSKNYNFIFYCASGWRSALSTLTAKQMGFLKNVSHIEGGFNQWLEINGPIEKLN
tara:strand:+ start:2505 stop:2909 length:405 start_codon:yes stop_codon:yes gene_type:complete